MAPKKDAPRKPKKRAYRAPRLTTFGTLAALTGGKGSNRNDTGGMPKTRTAGGA